MYCKEKNEQRVREQADLQRGSGKKTEWPSQNGLVLVVERLSAEGEAQVGGTG